jgi:hypothetical protein
MYSIEYNLCVFADKQGLLKKHKLFVIQYFIVIGIQLNARIYE